MSHDPAVDAYIDRAQPFARPILTHLRALVHAACPDAVEAIKWSSPHFLHRGRGLCMMAAFKAHASFGFWNGGAVLKEPLAAQSPRGQFGRLTTLDDLPDDATLIGLIRDAVALADAGEKVVRIPKAVTAPAETPAELIAALAAVPAARATFEAFPPGQRREYVDWIAEAKRPETRARRIAQAVEWLAASKRRNWKYE